MTRVVFLNGRYINYSKAKISIEDRGFQFADGVYEVIAYINNDFIDPKIFIISGSSFKLPLPICRYLGTQTRTFSLLIKRSLSFHLIYFILNLNLCNFRSQQLMLFN